EATLDGGELPCWPQHTAPGVRARGFAATWHSRRDHQAQGRRRRPHGHRRCHTRRGGHAGRADRRVRDRHPSGPGGRRHAVLHGPGQLGEPEPGGDPDVSRRRGADQVRDQAL
ncbi:MAG: Dihydrofolate reductase, partial [uncultured Solirubrobacteraceae bacterium]